MLHAVPVRVASCCWLVALAAGVARAGDPVELMTADTAVVVRVDLARVDLAALARLMFGREPAPPNAARGMKELGDRVAALREAGIAEAYGLLELTDEAGLPVLALPLADVARARAALNPPGPTPWTFAAIRGWTVFGLPDPVNALSGAQPQPRPDLVAALREGPADAAVRVAFAPGEKFRRAAEESLPALPPILGGGPVRTLSEGLTAATLTLSGGPEPAVAGVARARDAAAAAGIAAVLDRLKEAGLKALAANPTAKDLVPALTQVAPRVRGDRVEVAVEPERLRAAADALAAVNRRAALDAQGINNLKQMALAMHNFHATFNTFPSAFTTDAQGKPLLSWRVAILPYVEEQALYNEFHLDEPWDSPHNKALIPLPKVYVEPLAAPALAAEGRTIFLAPRGEGTIFPGAKGVGLFEITDGTSNTLLILEAEEADAVPWTKPDDREFVAIPKPVGRKAYYAMADGSVHRLRDDMTLATFRALLTRAGGEVIGIEDY